jgi:general secretion pathway protein H
MLTLVAGDVAPTLATACAALPPMGALAPWGGPASLSVAPTLATACAALPPMGALAPWGGPASLSVANGKRSYGFTLLELLVVIAIIAIATAGVSLALRDSNSTALEREAQRLAAVLEAGRSQSRTTGLPVRWQANAEGFLMVGNITPGSDKLQPWLTPGITAQTGSQLPIVLLGPEPIIAAQSITLRLEDRRIYVATDGLQPFRVKTAEPDLAGS